MLPVVVPTGKFLHSVNLVVDGHRQGIMDALGSTEHEPTVFKRTSDGHLFSVPGCDTFSNQMQIDGLSTAEEQAAVLYKYKLLEKQNRPILAGGTKITIKAGLKKEEVGWVYFEHDLAANGGKEPRFFNLIHNGSPHPRVTPVVLADLVLVWPVFAKLVSVDSHGKVVAARGDS